MSTIQENNNQIYPGEKLDGEDVAVVPADYIPVADYNPKDEQGNRLKGYGLRRQARIDADKLLDQDMTPEEFGYLPGRSRNNAIFNRIYNRRNRKAKYKVRRDVRESIDSTDQIVSNDAADTKQVNVNSRDFFKNLEVWSTAFGRGDISYDQIPELYRPYVAKTREEQQSRWRSQQKGQEQFNQIMKEKGWDKLGKAWGIGMSSLLGAGVLSGAIGSLGTTGLISLPSWSSISPVITHGLTVLANPLAAKTTAGALIATGLDAAGTVYGIQANSDLINKWSSGRFNWADIPEFALNLIPGWGVSNVAKSIKLPSTIKNLTKPFRNFNRVKNMETWYTGVPHKPTIENPAVFMDDNFSNYNGVIWTSDSKDYAKMFADDLGKNPDRGTVYKVLIEPKKLNIAHAPTAPNGTTYFWKNLPFKFENGGFKQIDGSVIGEPTTIFSNPNISLKYKDSFGQSKNSLVKAHGLRLYEGIPLDKFTLPNNAKATGIPLVDTDDIVRNVSNDGRFSAVKINNIFDGGYLYKNKFVDTPVNELIILNNTPHDVLREDESKWRLLFKNLDGIGVGGERKIDYINLLSQMKK